MNTNLLLNNALHAMADAQERIVPGTGDGVRKFANERCPVAPALEHPPLRSLSEVEAERESVARHNAYGWIRPDADACEICQRKAYATPVDGFMVRECTRCERLICEECSDADADCDQDGYFLTSWVCNGEARSECERLEAESEVA